MRMTAAWCVMMLAIPASAQRLMKPIPHGNPGEWFDPDSYPAEAIRAQRQGRVVVALGIDSTGAVATCAIKGSSGTAALDEGTCAIARERGRFDPATDRKGRPVAGEYVLPVRWQLPDTPPPALDAATLPPHRAFVVEVAISAEGTVASCKVIDAMGLDKNVDPCAGRTIGQRAAVVQRDGHPVAYRVVQHLTEDLVTGE